MQIDRPAYTRFGHGVEHVVGKVLEQAVLGEDQY